jgi:hypothetical protein
MGWSRRDRRARLVGMRLRAALAPRIVALQPVASESGPAAGTPFDRSDLPGHYTDWLYNY